MATADGQRQTLIEIGKHVAKAAESYEKMCLCNQ